MVMVGGYYYRYEQYAILASPQAVPSIPEDAQPKDAKYFGDDQEIKPIRHCVSQAYAVLGPDFEPKPVTQYRSWALIPSPGFSG